MAHILPSGGGKALINVDDTVLLLLDHQTGLFQTVKDISVAELRANVIALARIATLLKIPVITTASVPDGPNGPIMGRNPMTGEAIKIKASRKVAFRAAKDLKMAI